MPLTLVFPFNWRVAVVLVVLVGLVPLGWYLGSPLFISRLVSEASPAASTRADPQSLDTMLPRVVASGSFGAIDGVHKGHGSASLIRLDDGPPVLRFEDFQVTNGPDLYVYLSANSAPRSSAELHERAAFEVGQLKGNVGDQNYTLPADLNLDDFSSAVIYCRRFEVVFSTAELRHEGGQP